ncbi:phage recombination protein Bet [Curtobacterium sp. Csp1]|uniref:phage recombination protein Bet n=1 Tax=unclassified Curtobacterium TaxID=257496 RepID=UPI001597A1FC|nr:MULTISPECIES: phage recombination protein Bet [unclassified Curtobacterium]QKS13920.1 phage recombination protein Bet [Curtobacterium sp. csp3]QKS20963.1 phage recombination protein Bet [Curtobacterium sp. Csp1]
MTNAVVALPTTGDETQWNASERALVEAAGLVTGPAANRRLAPRPVVEAFLMHAARTGLDPIARQIYCIERGGKWGTQVSIDGARLVAERTGQYRGQTATQWTSDGVTWVDVWLASDAPKAARVGVHREGFVEPLYAVATFDAYNAGGNMWRKMPALMLGKCAEMLALRKAFPQDLSGLYSTEEMDQAQAGRAQQQRPQEPEQPALVAEVVEPSEDWFAAAAAVSSRDEANALWRRIPKPERSAELEAAVKARLVVLAEAEKPSEPEAAPQWAEQGQPVTDWATAEVPQADEDVETVDGVLDGTEVEQAAPSSGYDR